MTRPDNPATVPPRLLYVLAGTYQQAVYATRHLPPKVWRYVMEPHDLDGIHGGQYIIVGTFWERRDASELYDRARVAGLENADD